MPQWEVPDQQPQRRKDGPEDEAVVDVCCCIEHAGPGIWSFKSLNKWLVLSTRLSARASTPKSCHILLFDEGIVEKLRVPMTTSVNILLPQPNPRLYFLSILGAIAHTLCLCLSHL